MKARKGSILSLILGIIAGIALIAGGFYFFGSEKAKAAIEVAKDNAENKMVDAIGKIEVAEKLAIKRIEDIKLKLIKVKTVRRTINRHLQNPKLTEEHKLRYQALINKLDEVDARATKAYKTANAKFEELRANLEIVEAEMSITKAATSVLGADAKSLTSGRDLEKVIESIYVDLDKANAELDVALMDTK